MRSGLRLALPLVGTVVLVTAGSSPARAQGLAGAVLARLATLEETVADLERRVETLESASAGQASVLGALQSQLASQQSTVAGLELAVAALQKRQPALRLTSESDIVENGGAFRWSTGIGMLSFNDPGEDSTVPMWDPASDRIIRIPKDGVYFVNVNVLTDQSTGIDEGRVLSLRKVGSDPLFPCSGGQVLSVTHDATYDPAEMLFPFRTRTLRLTAAVPLRADDAIVVCHSFNGGAFNRPFQHNHVASYLEVIFMAPTPQ